MGVASGPKGDQFVNGEAAGLAVGATVRGVWVGNVEAMKWLGVVAMLVDHVPVYAFGGGSAVTELVGALAFPLFAVAFAIGLADASRETFRRVLARLMVWAFIAQIGVATVRDEFHGTALATFLFGVILYLGATSTRHLFVRAGICAVALVFSFAVEYMAVGVVLVAAAIAVAVRGGAIALGVAASCLVTLAPFNGNHGALLAIPVVAAVSALRADLPRVRRAFYIVYCGQFPVLRVLRELFS